MGWLELFQWVGTMNRQMNREFEATQPNPHAWSQVSRENFEDLDAKRRKLRGR